jgi:DNA repair protein RadC
VAKETYRQVSIFDEEPLLEQREKAEARRLREALAPYINVRRLRRLASESSHLHEALRMNTPPEEVLDLLETLATVLRPAGREQITSPAEIAALLMVEMGHLTQEQLRVVCLNTKNYVQTIHLVYQGSLNSSVVRIAEIFREPLRLNSAAIIVAHNHPSGDPIPSPEDIAVTRQMVEAGRLLECEVLDHLVIGQGRWVSLRERRLGFSM